MPKKTARKVAKKKVAKPKSFAPATTVPTPEPPGAFELQPISESTVTSNVETSTS
jgi:hypothetical protein